MDVELASVGKLICLASGLGGLGMAGGRADHVIEEVMETGRIAGLCIAECIAELGEGREEEE